MRLIDADALEKTLEKLWNVHDDQDFANKDVWLEIENAPSLEGVTGVIRCENCKWWDRLEDGHPYGYCRACRSGTHTERWEISIHRQNRYDFYCADAELKENEDEDVRDNS